MVIGNAAYEVGRLTNPRNDAADVAKALEDLGFTVIRGDDLNRSALFRKVQAFRSALRPGGIGVVFYSGHGIEVGGRNFLLPVDNGRIQTAEDVPVEAFDAQNLIDQMEASGTRLNVVILDACRDNPLPARWRSAGTKGLRAMEAEQGTLIAYATRAGAVAADGQGRNSPYTEVLLRHLSTPVPVTTLFNRVGLEVVKSTGSQQVPWVSTSPVPELSLAGTTSGELPGFEGGPLVAEASPGAIIRDRMRSGAEAPEMIVLPAGVFRMGSPEEEARRESDEGPQKMVSVGTFALGRYEVTRGEFAAFVASAKYTADSERSTNGATGCHVLVDGAHRWTAAASWREPGFDQDDRHPVVCVSWNDAQAYVRWLSRETGRAYRLPSEAELEYAIRAGSQTPWAWGTNHGLSCAYANIADTSVMRQAVIDTPVQCNDGWVFTSPVGSKPANSFGVHDVVGNVWELAEDCHQDGYVGTATGGDADLTGDCKNRALRGGSWNSRPGNFRSADRGWGATESRSNSVGFRLARGL